MSDSTPAHFKRMPRWFLMTVVLSSLIFGASMIGSALFQAAKSREQLYFSEQDAQVIGSITRLAPAASNEAFTVHALNASVHLKGVANHQALGTLSIGVGIAFLAVGLALFFIGADGAFNVQVDSGEKAKIVLAASAPGLLCFCIAGLLVYSGTTRRYDLRLGDYDLVSEQPTAREGGHSVKLAPQTDNSGQFPNSAWINEFCMDRQLLRSLYRPSGGSRVTGGTMRAISPIGKLWMNGSTLRVGFMDGSNTLQKRVQEIASEWSKHANIAFLFDTDKNAEIRVSFQSVGRWSFIGTDAREVPIGEPTMGLSGITESTAVASVRAVVLHQFGHALGLSHEHPGEAAGISWNVANVEKVFGGPPNHWDKEAVRMAFIERYRSQQINGRKYDDRSIMRMPIPRQLLVAGEPKSWVAYLSPGDIETISSAKLYPKTQSPGGV